MRKLAASAVVAILALAVAVPAFAHGATQKTTDVTGYTLGICGIPGNVISGIEHSVTTPNGQTHLNTESIKLDSNGTTLQVVIVSNNGALHAVVTEPGSGWVAKVYSDGTVVCH